jgi:ribosome-binding factor A
MADRILKINGLIREQLGQIINVAVEFPPQTILTITRVVTSADLRQANIYVSILPAENEHKAMKILIKEAFNLQRALNEKIVLRSIPKLRFRIDREEQKAAEIDRLLDNLK